MLVDRKLANMLGMVVVTYFQEREIPQEDVHRGVKASVPPHSTGNGCIPHQGQGVGHREEPEVEELRFGAGGKAHEDKVADGVGGFSAGNIHEFGGRGDDISYCTLVGFAGSSTKCPYLVFA